MNLFDTVRTVMDDLVGTRRAVDNCRHELARRAEAADAVERLCQRLETDDRDAEARRRPRSA